MRVLRRRGDLVISETRHGFVCANAGVDLSNMESGWAALLARGLGPLGPARPRRTRAPPRGAPWRSSCPTRSAGRGARAWSTSPSAVRAWPPSSTCAAVDDALGRELAATEVCVADEIASAAELVMGKAASVPVAVVRGVDPSWLRRGSVAEEILRPPAEDLFR